MIQSFEFVAPTQFWTSVVLFFFSSVTIEIARESKRIVYGDTISFFL